jgi:predicted dehydrogenase
MRAILVGCGGHGGGTLLPAALAGGIRVVGLVDTDLARARALSAQWSVPRAFGSVEDVPAGWAEAAILALPIAEQACHVDWALAHGLHVFVEKPPAADLPQLRALIGKAEASGRACCVGMNFRHADGVQALLGRLGSMRHGEVAYARVVQVARKPTAPLGPGLSLEASLFHAQGIHAIDLALTLVPGTWQVSGQLMRVSRGGLCVVAGESGDAGRRFEASFGSCAAGLYHQLDVFSDTGDLLSLRNLSELLYLPNGGEQSVEEFPGARVLWRRSPVSVGYESAGYAGELAAFKEAVWGQEPVSGSLARRAARLARLPELLASYEVFDQVLRSRGLAWMS